MSEQERVKSEQVGSRIEDGLLAVEERAACELIAKGDAPHSQRAQALLTLDGGASQAEAAEASGLSVGQVRYWLGRFHTRRLSIFPAETREPAQVEPAVPAVDHAEAEPEQELTPPVTETPTAVEEVPKMPEAKSKPKKKKKKAKKGKKASGKAKKAKADKKPKKKKAKKSKKAKKRKVESGKKPKKKGKKAKKSKSSKES